MRRGKHRKLEPFRAHLDRNGQRYYAASGVELRYDIFNHQWIVLEDDAPGQYRVTDGVVERSRGTFKKGQAWGRGPAPKNPPPRSTGPGITFPESPSLVGWTKPEPITYNAPDDGPDRPCSFCGHGAYQEHDDGGCNWKFDPMSGVGLCCTCPGVDYDPTKQTAPTIPSEAPEMPQEPRNWVSAPTTPSEAPGRLQTPQEKQDILWSVADPAVMQFSHLPDEVVTVRTGRNAFGDVEPHYFDSKGHELVRDMREPTGWRRKDVPSGWRERWQPVLDATDVVAEQLAESLDGPGPTKRLESGPQWDAYHSAEEILKRQHAHWATKSREWAKEAQTRPCCPDGGKCHHECEDGNCYRRTFCGPLSGVFPDDRWPVDKRNWKYFDCSVCEAVIPDFRAFEREGMIYCDACLNIFHPDPLTSAPDVVSSDPQTVPSGHAPGSRGEPTEDRPRDDTWRCG